MRLSTRLTATADISARQRETLFALMEQHHVNVQRDRIEVDLAPYRVIGPEPVSQVVS